MHYKLSSVYKRLRKAAFSTRWELDDEITALSQGVPSHAFLANPAGQYAYVYLTQYIKSLSQHHFSREFNQLQVLDWGCGKGHVSKLIRDLGPGKLDLCDVLAEKHDSSFGQQIPIIESIGLDVTPLTHEFELPFPNESFDIVLSFGVLEHVPNDAASLAEIDRVLRPNGLFFCFFLPTDLSWTQYVARSKGDDYHDRLYTKPKITNLLARTNLRLVDLWYRQLLPKNRVRYPAFRLFEQMDQLVTAHTPFRYFATNVEFVGVKASGGA